MNTHSIWRNFEYLKFFASFTTGNLGDWFDLFALQIIFANEFHASPIVLSLLFIIYLAPMAFLGSYAGIIADKFKKKNILLITDILSGVATVFLLLSTNLEISLLIIFIRSSLASINAPAQQALLKYIVSEKQLLAASSCNQIVFQLCQVIGPLLGASIIAVASPYWCIGVNAMSFFISAIFLLTLKPIVEIYDKPIALKFIANLALTFKMITENKKLLHIFIFASVLSIPVMMGFSQLVLLLKMLYPNNLGLLGILSGINGCGTIVAGVYLSRKKELVRYTRYLVAGVLLMMVSNIAFAIYPEHFYLIPLYCASFIGGIGFGIGIIVFSYLRNKETPHQYMGRVSGIMSMIMAIFYILGSFLGGICTSLFGIRSTFFVMSAICCTLIFYILWQKFTKST